MILLLYADGTKDKVDSIAHDILEAFRGKVEVQLVTASSPSPKPPVPSWNDLLVVIYDEKHFPDSGNDFIVEYMTDRNGNGLLLPIALNLTHTRPPTAAQTIKALNFDSSAPGTTGRCIRRIGAMLGFRVQKRDHRIFISYRASDGTQIAKQIEQHLTGLGYPVWRDEAQEMDGETKILPGSAVQSQIDKALAGASMVLLLDTPEAPHSVWITHEVDTANGLLLPILPLCFRRPTDAKKGPRFRSLFDLQRWVPMALSEGPSDPPLAEPDLNRIVAEMESYACELFQRKCRVPFIVEKEFTDRDYKWRILDERLLMCESTKQHSTRLTTKVLSHCSVFEQVYSPALKRFSQFLKQAGHTNHSLYIYDGELIPEPQLNEIIKDAPEEENVVILHHQELAALIDSNFTTFTK